MERDKLIKKWLNHELKPDELEAFKQLEDYQELTKLDNALQQFRPSSFEVDAELIKLQKTIKKGKSKPIWKNPLWHIAAVIVLCLGIYYYTITLNTHISTLASQTTSVILPDQSEAQLNAGSSITYNKSNWGDKREVQLNGEAYFKVAKGVRFQVKTELGTITVLGTQFNVKQRKDYFEVICYEGSVEVQSTVRKTILKPGDQVLVINGKPIHREKEIAKNPAWVEGSSQFISIPLYEVLNELERQYNISIQMKQLDTSRMFTGRFTHTDLDLALKSICTPMQLTYSQSQNSVTITGE
ncbi:FecR family protein [Mangrovimonas aestuarii]|uniref:FecR family protein n=1 Tax=Mangrovimonas aestuarii TaxID=3018443 RepID=UPI0023785630|nr:FecR family protein [Mangrovimonas aestuarii]